MQQVLEQPKNIFGFPVVNEDDRLFEKTASFFCPHPQSAKKEETSFSTVVTDETKENSAPATPEKSKRVKICKISSKASTTIKNIGAFTNLRDTFEKSNKLPIIIKSNDTNTVRQIQDIRNVLPRVFFSQRSQRPSRSVNESNSEVKYDAKDLIFTTDVSFENENTLNMTFNDRFNEAPTETLLDQKLSPKNFVIRSSSNKNKLQISKFNKIGTFNPFFNSHNLAPSVPELPETEPNKLQQKISQKIKPRYLTLEGDADTSKKSIQSILSQIPQSFAFEEHIQRKLGTLSHLIPNTTTHASSILPERVVPSTTKASKELKNFRPVFAPKRDLSSIKNRAESQQPNINMLTSLDLNSFISPKGNARTSVVKERYPVSEILDTQSNRTLSKRPSSRFKPQEDLLEKLFNPSTQKNKN